VDDSQKLCKNILNMPIEKRTETTATSSDATSVVSAVAHQKAPQILSVGHSTQQKNEQNDRKPLFHMGLCGSHTNYKPMTDKMA
jgi:hypothetical protein